VLEHEGLVVEEPGAGHDEQLGGEGAVEEGHQDGGAHEHHPPQHLRRRTARRRHLHQIAVLLAQRLHPCVLRVLHVLRVYTHHTTREKSVVEDGGFKIARGIPRRVVST
jgi:hypothetical protein